MIVRALLLGLVALMPLAGGTASAATLPAVYAFGDSLSDAGNVYTATAGAEPISPPYNFGRFSNGPVWVQDLAAAFGRYPLTPSLRGGTDFAYGGAESGQTMVHTLNATDLASQLAQFAAQVPRPKDGALYTLWIGSNDLFSILSTPGLSPTQITQTESQILLNEAVFVYGLVTRGARDLLVVTVPDLGETPLVRAQGTRAMQAATALSADFDRKLVPTMQALARWFGIRVLFVDSFALLRGAVADPAAYGFANATSPCWTGSFTSRSGTVCGATAAVQDTYVFWDHIHPTEHGHGLIATAARAAILAAAGLVAN